MFSGVWRGVVIERRSARSSVTKDKECWLEFGEGELLKDVQHRGIRTRSDGLEFGEGELLRDAQLGVRRIRTRSDGSEFGEGELLREV